MLTVFIVLQVIGLESVQWFLGNFGYNIPKMTDESDLDWPSVKFVFYDTGSNAKNNLCILLKFIEQRFVCFVLFYFDYNI